MIDIFCVNGPIAGDLISNILGSIVTRNSFRSFHAGRTRAYGIRNLAAHVSLTRMSATLRSGRNTRHDNNSAILAYANFDGSPDLTRTLSRRNLARYVISLIHTDIIWVLALRRRTNIGADLFPRALNGTQHVNRQ